MTIQDTTGPDIVVNPPGTPNWSGSGDDFTVVFTGHASDPQTGVTRVIWSVDGSTFSPATPAGPSDWTTWTVLAHPLKLGNNTLLLRAIDGVRPPGNATSQPVPITIVDPIGVNIDPLPLTVHPDPGSATTATLSVTGTATDTLVGAKSVEVTLDPDHAGATVTATPDPGSPAWARWRAAVTIPALGRHVILVRATSTLGTVSSQMVTVEVVFHYPLEDPTPPTCGTCSVSPASASSAERPQTQRRSTRPPCRRSSTSRSTA